MPNPPPRLRPALAPDLPEIQAIYAHHVLHGTGSFEEEPPPLEEMARRFAAVTGRRGAWLVAEDETGVLGYAYFSQLRERSAYRFAAEDSVYIRPDAQGRGVGRALLCGLLDTATAGGWRQMVAVIGDAANFGSIRLHAALGFREIGRLEAVGRKFDRWLDCVYMQRALGAGAGELAGGCVCAPRAPA